MTTTHPKPLVSVIMRTKNRPHLLPEALQSVARQTYLHIEAVVVNDGGCEVGDLAQSFAPSLTAVRYVTLPESRGLAGAANAGLDAATGEYLIFLDDDDLFEPEHIAGLMAALEQSPGALVAYSGTRMEGPDGVAVWDQPFDPVRLRTFGLFGVHAALFSRRLLTLGCRFDESLPAYDDWDFWLQAAEHTEFIHVEQVSAVYRAFGTSGYGAFSFDPDKAAAGRRQLMAKWAHRWSIEDLAAQVELARTLYLHADLERRAEKQQIEQVVEQMQQALAQAEQAQQQLSQQVQQLQQRNQIVAADLAALRRSRSYRLGRALTAPWRKLRRRGQS